MDTSVREALLVVALTASLATRAALSQAVPGGPLPGPLPFFPSDNWWNVDVSAAPLDPGSADFITFIGAAKGLHPDLGGDASPAPSIYGFPWVVVSGAEPLEILTFDYADESDVGAPGRPPGYPIPAEAKNQPKWIEGGYPGNSGAGGDRHMLIVDTDNRLLFETYATRFNTALNRWEAGSGAIFSLDSNHRRPDGWTSADAAGLAILPGLIRYDEVYGPDPIRHAFRFTVRATNGYAYPASHRAGSTAGALPMGARLRLKGSKDISGYSVPVRKIFQAMKTYGLIVADNGSDMYVQGTYDTRWENNVLNPAFGSLHASDFEVVRLGWQPAVPSPSSALLFYVLAPCRAVDTRNPAGSLGGPALAAAATRLLTLAGACGIPADASAVSMSVTVADATGTGSLQMFPGAGPAPGTNTISFGTGNNRTNIAVLGLVNGALSILNGQTTGSINVIIDVNGYFQ